MSMVKQWRLKPKDKLLWRWEVIDGKMVAIVNKYEGKNRPTISEKELKKKK